MRRTLHFLAYICTALVGVVIGYTIAVRPTLQVVAPPSSPEAALPEPVAPLAPGGPLAPRMPPLPKTSSPDPAPTLDFGATDPEPPDPSRHWSVRQEEATTPGQTNVFLSVQSEAPLTCGPRRRASLMLRCLEDRTAIYVAHDCATPPTDPSGWAVDLQFDDAPMQGSRMQVDDRGEALGYWDYRDARPLIERLIRVDQLEMRFVDVSGQENRLRFSVAGLAGRIGDLETACHWSEMAPWMIGPASPPPPGPSGEVVMAGADGTGSL